MFILTMRVVIEVRDGAATVAAAGPVCSREGAGSG